MRILGGFLGYRIRRTDSNQVSLVAFFRKWGICVVVISEIGRGIPDLMLSFNGKTVLVEIKDGAKKASNLKLTTDEERFHKQWQGEIRIIKNEAEAIELIKYMKNEVEIK